ncbi:MAG TPA: hypothetical protein VEL47_00755 [Myxococcota bacterium]|nr:hypothetical protein [Myxococcota bacterium]
MRRFEKKFVLGEKILLSGLILALSLCACVDYIKIAEDNTLGETFRFAPVIDTKHLSPHPSRLYETISVGKNCHGVVFLVPPIQDRNKKDRLYYLWFLDNRLAGPRSIIEPEARSSAVVSLRIDQQFLLSHFETKIPGNFFGRTHVVEFFVSDVDYIIPESRLPNEAKKSNEDYAYWIVSFSNDPC